MSIELGSFEGFRVEPLKHAKLPRIEVNHVRPFTEERISDELAVVNIAEIDPAFDVGQHSRAHVAGQLRKRSALLDAVK